MKLNIDKITGTYADTLKAVGLAGLLAEITGHDVRVLNTGSAFVVEGADPGPVEGWPVITPGYPYIFDSKDSDVPLGWVLDYEREKEKAQAARDFRQAQGKKRERLETALREQGLNAPEAPVRDYRMASFLASMRKGWSSDKQLYRWVIDNQDIAKRHVASIFGLGQCSDAFLEISNSQVFNPISGKGVHRPKPDSTAPAAINRAVINGVDEWLKFRGAYIAMLPYRSGDDFKVFVIEPGDIGVKAIQELRNELLDMSLFGGIRLDIDAALRLVERLIMHSEVLGQGDVVLFGRRPSSIINGLQQAYFQSLGTAAALMNYAFMPLPSWFAVSDREAALAYVEIIKEHVALKSRDGETGCLQVLREDNSGDIPILQAYREWLLAGELDMLLDFFSRYAVKVMEERGKKEWVREFSDKGLDELLGRGYDFVQEITQNEGFRNMARAIRNATIYALSLKNREVKFGLAQEWKQKIRGGDNEFVPALSDFTQQYNWESEKIRAHVVRQEDLDAVVGLIEQHGSELVGMLLLAYGYARAPKTEHESKIEKEIERGDENIEA
ncbi:MAG: hypothetical protein QME41_05425 [Actinomycetota bacterium]|nr:hypothetical protein [Actinomycetota bacterium]